MLMKRIIQNKNSEAPTRPWLLSGVYKVFQMIKSKFIAFCATAVVNQTQKDTYDIHQEVFPFSN